MEAAHERDISIPEQLSVVGFDDAPAADTRSLTTVHQDHGHKGRLAAELLVAALHGDAQPEPRLLPHRLVPRDTTARPAGER
jgi:DNA-binding LacI/PurR family transcriptional regulator